MFAIFSLMNAMLAAAEIFFAFLFVALIAAILLIWQSVRQKKKNQEKARQINEIRKSINFCRNCGARIKPEAPFCRMCGARTGSGRNFCFRCGKRTDNLAIICVSCGVSLEMQNTVIASDKSKITAGFLALLFGAFGVHNFYLGYTIKAFAQLILSIFFVLTNVLFGFIIIAIWGFIEGVLIFSGAISKDAAGAILK